MMATNGKGKANGNGMPISGNRGLVGSIEDSKLEWNRGVFYSSILSDPVVGESPIARRKNAKDVRGNRIWLGARLRTEAPPPLQKGTLNGTAIAADQVYKMIVKRHSVYYDVANFESTVPRHMEGEDRRQLYTWEIPDDPMDYPPHLAVIPKQDQTPLTSTTQTIAGIAQAGLGWIIPRNIWNLFEKIKPREPVTAVEGIFDSMDLLNTSTLLGQVFPEEVIDFQNFRPADGATIADIENKNRTLIRNQDGIYTVKNIGSREDWYTDAVFAQQHLTGPNPCTLQLAPHQWIQRFLDAAQTQGNTRMAAVITSSPSNDLYIQDYSSVRAAIGVAPDAPLSSVDPSKPDSAKKVRYAVAPVCLFHLGPEGKLHPLGIIVDYRGSMEKSVTIFNKRLTFNDDTDSEATDWPWRYAKTCIQSADWAHHEVSVHLVRCHFIEEAAIVAAHRAFPVDHVVYRLLQPHWLKTLSLNAAARTTLVPDVVIPLSGFTAPQLMKLIQNCYDTFNWTDHYVPYDLNNRGFPPERLQDDKFHNCAYAKNISVLWQIIRKYVSKYLSGADPQLMSSDASVATDQGIIDWCKEMRSPQGANIKSFPEIKTRDQLIDTITMTIHIASPQHTAVNYLQEYYQTFVINKPPALYTPIPTTLKSLNSMDEKSFMEALPINKPRDWLLAAHLPHLLNLTVAEDQNLVNYARSVYAVVQDTTGGRQTPEQKKVGEAAREFWEDLKRFGELVEKIEEDMDNGNEYRVLDPDVTAVSILI